MQKRILTIALAMMGISAATNAQFTAFDAEGNILYTSRTTPAYMDFECHGDGVENGHVYVDLGLSDGTLWATCNIGAENPWDYGDYFAWGETETYYSAGGNIDNPTWKDGYSSGYLWSNYKYSSNGSETIMTKYSTLYNSSDKKTELDDVDDVAVQTWGGKWRIPTKAQKDILRTECYWVWTSSYNNSNVAGYIIYKAKNDSDKNKLVKSGQTPSPSYNVDEDAHIFLPAAGYFNKNQHVNKGTDGEYWSHSLHSGEYATAYALDFNANSHYDARYSRCMGLSVRPVTK